MSKTKRVLFCFVSSLYAKYWYIVQIFILDWNFKGFKGVCVYLLGVGGERGRESGFKTFLLIKLFVFTHACYLPTVS